MNQNATPKATANQDSFDKAFIKLLYALQQIGFCKNVLHLERLLGFADRTLSQVLYGNRSVPKLKRQALLKFFTENYNANPRFFTNNMAAMFKDEPPTPEEQPEAYFSKDEKQRPMTMGDVVELERLRREAADDKATIKELKKEVKYWRDLYNKGVKDTGSATGTASKTGHKTGQRKK